MKRPHFALFERVSLGTVVTVLAAVLLITVGSRVLMLSRAAGADLDSIQRERVAVADDARLRSLLILFETNPQRPAVRTAIARQMRAMTVLSNAQAGLLDARAQWRAVQAAWTAGDRRAAVRAMQNLWAFLNDRSGLQYDANRYAQNYAQIVFAKVPNAIDEIFSAAAIGRKALLQGSMAIPERVNLAYLVNHASADFDLSNNVYAEAPGAAYTRFGTAFRNYVTSHILDRPSPSGDPALLQRDAVFALMAAQSVGSNVDAILADGLTTRADFIYQRNRFYYALLMGGAALVIGLTLLIIEMGSRRTRQELQHAQEHSERLTAELARQKAERALRLSEAQFRAVFDGAAVGIAILGRDGTILDSNAVFRGVFGTNSVNLLRGHEAEFAALVRGERELFEFEQQAVTPADQEAWADCTLSLVKDDNGRPYFAICMFRDVTDLKRNERRMLHEMTHDPLTGLPNRLLFESRLREQLVELRASPRASFAVLLVDLDRFREINEGFGHDSGEFVVSQVAQRLGTAVAGDDVVARIGTDQFAILARSLNDVLHLEVMARRLLGALAKPMSIGSHSVYISASVGIAVASLAYHRAEELIRDAQVAMRYAKSSGGARTAIFDSRMHARAEKRLQLSTDLRAALDGDEFFLVYQPIVHLDSGDFYGCEALLRWNHPSEGVLPPGEFLALAEQIGLSGQIGRIVARIACRQLAQWRDERRAEVLMSINVSWSDLLDAEFESALNSLAREYSIKPAQLTLEITENIVLDPGGRATQLVERLRRRGFGICIDDFGTGYSSLRYLQQFKIDSMKIDRSFVCGPNGDVASEPIVRTLMALAHAFDVRVVAEGIETQRQYDVLRHAECKYGQGYYFARPLTTEELVNKYPAVFGAIAQSASV